MRRNLKYYYESKEPQAVKFRYCLLAFDIVMLAYLVVSSFYYGNAVTETIDIFFGVAMLADLLARASIAKRRLKFLLKPITITDMIAMFSLLLPLVGENLAFLRVARLLRLLRSYHVMESFAHENAYFHKNKDIICSSLNLLIFIFVMTALVFETQVGINQHINNYLDALYFTVATLTTTGFGDITMQGSIGRLLSVFIMIFGVSLFIRLIQTVFRPFKVRFECANCGLYLHDRDAICCKHCGNTIAIPDDGLE